MKNCPICRKTLRHQSFADEEDIEKCNNPKCKGYSSHWYFGYSELNIGKWESGSFVNHCYVKDKEALYIISKMEKEFALRIRYFKRRWKKC